MRWDEAPSSLIERYRLQPMPVLDAREMVDATHPLGSSKRFLRLRLPAGEEYRTADHLALLPRNPGWLVERALRTFGVAPENSVQLPSARRGLPGGEPMPLATLLTNYLELQAPAPQSAIAVLAQHTRDAGERERLEALGALDRDTFRLRVTDAGRSVLDLLDEHPSCVLPLDEYLALARPLRLRSYSISSSPLIQPDEVDLMVSLLREPHRAGTGEFQGIATAFLLEAAVGDTIYARVTPCQEAFRLPGDPQVPVILVSAGTGLAPFRAMVAERRLTPGGTMLCYFGCRHPDVDFLHREELEAADASGAVSVRPAFSRAPVGGLRYVQDRLAADSAEIWQLLEQGAHVRVCGDGRSMAPDVQATFRALYREHTRGSGEDAEAWLRDLMVTGRYVEDVWAG